MKFSWKYLFDNRVVFNTLFSGYYEFSELQLINFHCFLELGDVQYEITSGIISKSRLGLIFNQNICWTSYLQVLFYIQPEVIYAGDGTDVNNYQFEFNKLPIDKKEEIQQNRDFQESLIIQHHNYVESEEDINNLMFEIDNNNNFYKLIINRTSFSEVEMFRIIAESDLLYLFNENLYSNIFDKIVKDIPDFTIEKFYSLFLKYLNK